MKIIFDVLALLTLFIVKFGFIPTLILATKGVITFDCFVLVTYINVLVLYLEAMYGERKKNNKKNYRKYDSV